MRETWAQARSLRDDLLRLGYSDARVLAPAVMPPYPRARELAGVSRFATTKEGEKIDKRRKATMIALRLRASLAHEYAFAEKTRSRIKGLSLTIADLESQLAQAVARAETAEEELQRLRHPVRMSGKAIHGRGHGKLDAAA
jgi:cell division protein FtsB